MLTIQTLVDETLHRLNECDPQGVVVADYDIEEVHVVAYTHWGDMDKPCVDLRFVAPLTHPQVNELRELAYRLAFSLCSETSNNDACDITVRERSAHLHLHDDIGDYGSDDWIVVDATVDDYLS